MLKYQSRGCAVTYAAWGGRPRLDPVQQAVVADETRHLSVEPQQRSMQGISDRCAVQVVQRRAAHAEPVAGGWEIPRRRAAPHEVRYSLHGSHKAAAASPGCLPAQPRAQYASTV